MGGGSHQENDKYFEEDLNQALVKIFNRQKISRQDYMKHYSNVHAR